MITEWFLEVTRRGDKNRTSFHLCFFCLMLWEKMLEID